MTALQHCHFLNLDNYSLLNGNGYNLAKPLWPYINTPAVYFIYFFGVAYNFN